MMNRRTFTTELGAIDIGDVEINEDLLCVFIKVENVSKELQREVDKAIEKAKKEKYEEFYNQLGWNWSDEGVSIYGMYIYIEAKDDKSLEASLCVYFADKVNDHMEADVEIKLDLSAYKMELKFLVAKAVVLKFFKDE